MKKMPRAVLLMGLSAVALCLGIWLGLRRQGGESTIGSGSQLTPEYLAKREILRPLYYEARQTGSLSPASLETIRRMVRDARWEIRVRALTVLIPVRDPRLRQDVIQIAMSALRDPEWVVRNYAMRVLAAQNARECIPAILPLLNAPQPEVRQQARKTLQQLGYKVGE